VGEERAMSYLDVEGKNTVHKHHVGERDNKRVYKVIFLESIFTISFESGAVLHFLRGRSGHGLKLECGYSPPSCHFTLMKQQLSMEIISLVSIAH
jgi:hypothetical protein